MIGKVVVGLDKINEARKCIGGDTAGEKILVLIDNQ